ncbi:MAG: PAS domain S-box protein [Elusimicrobiota bacterium]|nr:MAG: PAS domain S-box protein [Elusimicrobiota bacterium]
MFGYTEKEIIGRNISLLFTREDRAKGIDESEFAKALKNGREDDERWHLRKDGKRIWCYGISFPLEDEKGKVRGFVKLIRDDTERKLLADLSRENEERLSLAAESTGLGTWDFDVARRTLHLSERAAVLFGLGTAPTDAGFEQFLERIHGDDRPEIAAKFQKCLEAGGTRRSNMEYRITMPDGSVRSVLTLARAFMALGAEPGGAVTRLIGTVVDITEQKRRQVAAEAVNEELELKVKERTASLTSVNKELETFAYSASHDLRAPIRKIAAFAQAVLQADADRLSPEGRHYFDRISAAALKMERLIDDILNLARATRKSIAYVDCDLTAIVKEIAAELQASEPGRRVELVIAAGAEARGDRELLEIALRNLLANAWKFTSKHPKARIEFGAKTVEGRRVYFVKDDGAGFDMRYAHKLFGAFQRLHPEEEFPGTGVGLGMVERIIRRHRGRLWAEGRVEGGPRSSSR